MVPIPTISCAVAGALGSVLALLLIEGKKGGN